MQIVTCIFYRRPEDTEWDCVWARVTARASNMLIANFDTLSKVKDECTH